MCSFIRTEHAHNNIIMCVSGEESVDRATKTKVPNTRMICLFCRVIIMGVQALSPVKFFSKNNNILFGYFDPVKISLDNSHR